MLQIFETYFWKSGLPGAPWPKVIYCVCTYVEKDGKEVKIKKNEPGKHVEKVILNELEKEGKPTEITMYLTYSPCNSMGCCDEIIKYKKQHPECQVTIIFPKLYRIEEKENKAGLISLLNEQGITLEPFNPEHWKALMEILNNEAQNNEMYTGVINYTEAEYKEKAREQQDQQLLRDWEIIKQEGNFFLLSFTLYCFTFGYFNHLNSFLLDIKQPGIQAMYDLGFKYFLTERCKPIQWYDHDTLPEIH